MRKEDRIKKGIRVSLPQRDAPQKKNQALFENQLSNPSTVLSGVIRTECKNHGYHVIKTLGEGAYAKVKLAEVMPSTLIRNEAISELAGDADELQVAIKVINKKFVPKEFLRKFLPREIENHSKLLPHKYIVRVYETFQTQDNIYLVMDYCSKGDLLDLINKYIGDNQKGIGEELSRKIFKQVCSALQHIHNAGIVHRDMKCENILLDDNMDSKLTDFGFSRAFDEKGSLLKTSCGSYAYTAPEIIKNKPYNGFKSDMWSLGIILFAMVNGRLPFNDSQLVEMEEEMKMQRLRFERNVSFDCMVLIRKLLQYSPHQRPCLMEIAEDSWLTGKKPIPRQLNKPKWATPCHAEKNEENDTTKENGVNDPPIVSPKRSQPVCYNPAVKPTTVTGTVTLNHKAGETVTLKSRRYYSPPRCHIRPKTWPTATQGSTCKTHQMPQKTKTKGTKTYKGPDIRQVAQMVLENKLKQGDIALVNKKEISKQVPMWIIQKILESESEKMNSEHALQNSEQKAVVKTKEEKPANQSPCSVSQVQKHTNPKPAYPCSACSMSTQANQKPRASSPQKRTVSKPKVSRLNNEPKPPITYKPPIHTKSSPYRRVVVSKERATSALSSRPVKYQRKATRTSATETSTKVVNREPCTVKKVEPVMSPEVKRQADAKFASKESEITPAERANSCRDRLLELYGNRYYLLEEQLPLPPLCGKPCHFEDKTYSQGLRSYKKASSATAHRSCKEDAIMRHNSVTVSTPPVPAPTHKIVVHCP